MRKKGFLNNTRDILLYMRNLITRAHNASKGLHPHTYILRGCVFEKKNLRETLSNIYVR